LFSFASFAVEKRGEEVSGFLAIMTADWTPTLARLSEAPRKFSQFRSEPSAVATVTLLVIALAILLVIGYVLARRLVGLAREPDPGHAIFAELAEAHALTNADRKLLRKLALREGLDDPAKVFVEKRHLEAYAKSDTNPAYRRLFERLFGA
jgi:hypothetical protein